MRIANVHSRDLPVSATRVAPLIDTLASSGDLLWPKHIWPAMRFDTPLGLGVQGGHGPVRYVVEAYEPGRSIRFRITAPSCLKGAHHGFEVIDNTGGNSQLRHCLVLECSGRAWVSWPLAWRPLHDALIEDALASAQIALNVPPVVTPWSLWVRIVRFLVSGGQAPAQGWLPVGRSSERGESS